MKKLVTSQWASKPAAVKMLCYKKDGCPFWAYLFSCPLSSQAGARRARAGVLMRCAACERVCC